jgi:hypothetical protein
MTPAIKSAFGKMTPTKLVASSAVAASAQPPARSTTKQQPSNGRVPERKAPIPAGPPIVVAVELWIETVNDTSKNCPCFAYVSTPHQEGVTRLTIAFNQLWPASGALQRGDQNALKWLAALALVDRHLTWRGHPILKAIGDHLAHLVGCPQEFKRGIWCAYALKDSELLKPIPNLVSNSKGPAKIAQFEIEVDSAKLDFWRQKMTKRFKKQPEQTLAQGQAGAGGNVV